MKTMRLFLIHVLFLLKALQSDAQTPSTFKLNWSSAFSPAWATSQTAGTALNVGGSGTDVSVSMAITGGGIFTTTQGSLGGGPMTPTVSESTYIVPGSTNNLMVALDFTRNTSYVDITFSFSTMVSGVSFRLADIDRMDSVLLYYLDEVAITGTDGIATILPTITKYDNSNPNYLIISGNIARVNTTNLIANNCASNETDQRGTINIAFGSALMNSVTIRYRNATGTQNNPNVQNISIGDITFQKMVLPVKLLSFDASVRNNLASLEWKATSETDSSHFILERSENGTAFSEIAHIPSHEGSNSFVDYRYNDMALTRSKYFYRLKMVDSDGSYSYSKVVVAQMQQSNTLSVFPTVFRDHLTLVKKTVKTEMAQVRLMDMTGRMVHSQSYQLGSGVNQFRVDVPSHLPAGPYFLRLDGENTIKVVKN